MADKQIFFEKNFIVAMILMAKIKYFNEQFVTILECNTVIQKLTNKLSEVELNIIIKEQLNNDYFDLIGDVIILNKEIDMNLENILCFYLNFIPMDIFDKFNNLISEDNFFYEAILDAKLNNILSSTEKDNLPFKAQFVDVSDTNNGSDWKYEIEKVKVKKKYQ